MTVAWPEGVTVREHEPLARHSPWRVGGPCDAWVVVHRREALTGVLSLARDLGWSRAIVGAGTRTVFRDLGLSGMVMRLGHAFSEVVQDGDSWIAGAGASLAVLAARVPGWDALRLAPGSVGGSLISDPGWDAWVDGVWVHARGSEREIGVEELRTRNANGLVTAVRIRPVAAPAPGTDAVAGWFGIEKGLDLRGVLRRANMGGVRLRDVWIPEVAPELLVNLGGASAKDLALLQRSAMDRLMQVSGVEITDRMRWVGRQG